MPEPDEFDVIVDQVETDFEHRVRVPGGTRADRVLREARATTSTGATSEAEAVLADAARSQTADHVAGGLGCS